MERLKIKANVENLDAVLAFIDGNLEAHDCPMKEQLQIDIAVEELFVNIAHYAYAPSEGDAEIVIDFESQQDKETGENAVFVVISFEDEGTPYDPLEKPDPDITLAAEEREIGGLGIFMVKKSMDDVIYAYENKKNILTIKKKIS